MADSSYYYFFKEIKNTKVGIIEEKVIIKDGREYKHIKEYCSKCNGTGEVEYKHIQGGKCFCCNGTGILEYEEKILNAEEKAEQIENSKKWVDREKQYKIESDNECLKNTTFNGCNALYLIDLEKTYNLRKQLKADKAIWLDSLGAWAMRTNEHKDKYPLIKVEYRNIVTKDESGKDSLRKDIEQYINSLPREV